MSVVAPAAVQQADEFDWGSSLVSGPPKQLMNDDPLELKWDEEEAGSSDEEAGLVMKQVGLFSISERGTLYFL